MSDNLSFEGNTTDDRGSDISRLLSKKFNVARKGYAVDEVREFIFDIELYFNKMLRREADLQLKLAEALKQAESPVLDEETLARAIGMESGKVLRAAHEASRDILSQAQQRAEEILSKASAVLAEQTSLAGKEADVIIEDAKNRAALELQETKDNCLEIIAEAKATRKSILSDLIERRSLLSRQILQMQAALETFQTIFADTARAVDEVNSGLANAENIAKEASERIINSHDSNIDKILTQDDDIFQTGRLEVEEPDTVESLGIDYLTRSDDALPESVLGENYDLNQDNIIGDEGQSTDDVSNKPQFALYRSSETNSDMADLLSLENDGSFFEPVHFDDAAVTNDESEADTVHESTSAQTEETWDFGADEGFRILGTQHDFSGNRWATSYQIPTEENTSTEQEASLVSNTHNLDERQADLSNISDLPVVFIQNKSSAKTDDEVTTLQPGVDILSENVDTGNNSDEDAPTSHTKELIFEEDVSEEIIKKQEPSFQGGDLDEEIIIEEDGDFLAEAKSAEISLDAKSNIDAIFAQIRAGRDKEVLQAISVLQRDSLAVAQLVDQSVQYEESDYSGFRGNVSDEGQVNDISSDTSRLDIVDEDLRETDFPLDKDFVQGFYDMLSEQSDTLLKRAKRIIRQHQNVVLNNLRVNKNIGVHDYAILENEALDDKDMEIISALLADIYDFGFSFQERQNGNLAIRESERFQLDFFADAKSLMEQILEPVAAPFRDNTLENDGSQQSEQDFMEHISLIYRDLRGERLERIVGDFVVSISCRGVYDRASITKDHLRWVMDPKLENCPDCEDNSLISSIVVGESFPTGHLTPPAHSGCRCYIMADFKQSNS